MKSVENTRRELFEAWYKNEFPASELRVQNLIGTYTKSHADLCWQAFDAALDSVVIELPGKIGEEHGGDFYSASIHDSVIAECQDAIETTNLGIKVK